MASTLKSKAKFVGRFPGSGTSCSFDISLPEGMGEALAPIFKKAFLTTMSEMYPDDEIRPALKKITITITLP